jgi:hypothetical protein
MKIAITIVQIQPQNYYLKKAIQKIKYLLIT